ncbi:hypothetical protein M569_04774 [Genlisea aurea]|uniref:Glycoside hydrolase family 31 N-terminal domain-containing protein n=1 Tax=Genlisea aurea TaxID=192259 RepID=S8CYA2_9LAMI|nr:hypothetical protein M569_04774 [Genlisea aurea]
MVEFKVIKKHHKRLNNPFPGTPRTLSFIPAALSFSSDFPKDCYRIGTDFRLNCSTADDDGVISIVHISRPEKSLWSTVPGKSFISAAVADTEVEESRGSFAVHDRKIHLVCCHQTIEDIREITRESSSVFQGRLFSFNNSVGDAYLEQKQNNQTAHAKYWMLFQQKNENQVGFQVCFGKPNFIRSPKLSSRNCSFRRMIRIGRLRLDRFRCYVRKDDAALAEEEKALIENTDSHEFNRICITYSSDRNERFYGFGEQFSHLDFKGKMVPILVQEQGIGRGDQPITAFANILSYRSGGDEHTTYAPSPFYITSKMRSVYLEGYNYSVFDLTDDDCVQIQVHSDMVEGRIIYGNSPVELIKRFTETIGRPQQLPEWIISGSVVGMQGGTNAVRGVLQQLKAMETPISAFWLQDWVGQRKTVIGSQLWWNWEVDSARYSGWKQLIEDLNALQINVMTYCNPCLAPMAGKKNVRRHFLEEAKKLDILVKDRQGRPYMVPNTAFDVGMLDLTNPRTTIWFKQILQEMVDDGVRGWMADFGEGLPVDACLYSGEDPIAAHNRYPELWARVNHEFVQEWKSSHKEQGDLVFFMRSGFRNSPKWTSLFWEGDQMVSWGANDGIKSAVIGLLSSGISGYSFNHSDIGGYCSVKLPFWKYQRSEELLLRWMELNAFTTIFRSHEGNNPSFNIQIYSNQRTLGHFSRFAKIYEAWKFYRIQLVKEASEKGIPVCRHLFLHYPKDEHVQRLTYQQFMVGTEILVAPVLDKNKEAVKVYFPSEEDEAWKHVWTGKLYDSEGGEFLIEAPIGYPAVFVKDGSYVGEMFLENLRRHEIL